MSKINLNAPIGALGYGVAGYNILKQLTKNGDAPALFPMGEPQWTGDPSAQDTIKGSIGRAQLYNKDAPSVRIWHQFSLDMFPGKGLRVGWPIFELDKFNEVEKHHLKNVDVLLVCSEWAKDVIETEGLVPPGGVHVVPLGVDMDIFSSNEQERNSRPQWTKDTTVFINVGKWEKRKGHEELLKAFNAAFEENDKVELWMINDNPFIGSENDAWKRNYVSSKLGRNIKFFPRLEKHADLAKIFNHADCGVFPSHAEGWNLEIPEMMACGGHIIATNYSGHSQYLSSDNSLMLDVTGMEVANDGRWFHGQGSWCQFDSDQLVEHMRTVHKKKQEGTLGINTVGIETATELSWGNSTSHMWNAIKVETVE